MTTTFAINGFGRIGRALARISRRHPQLQLVAVNDPASAAQLALRLGRDTLYGRYEGTVETLADGALDIDGHRVEVSAGQGPEEVTWGSAAPRLVVEASGALSSASSRGLLGNSVERVVLAWNPKRADEVDLTVSPGINDDHYEADRHRLLSCGSCTTNCIAPLARVLHRSFGLRRALVNTVHGYTNNQVLLDSAHADPRRGRAAALNIVPTPSLAAPAVGRVIPELAGRLEGTAVRVPAPHMALLDLVAELERPASPDEVRRQLEDAAEGELKGILGVAEDHVVSSDLIGDPRSAVVDLPLVQGLDDRLLRVVAWYDNEWGYANRLAELLLRLGGAS